MKRWMFIVFAALLSLAGSRSSGWASPFAPASAQTATRTLTEEPAAVGQGAERASGEQQGGDSRIPAGAEGRERAWFSNMTWLLLGAVALGGLIGLVWYGVNERRTGGHRGVSRPRFGAGRISTRTSHLGG